MRIRNHAVKKEIHPGWTTRLSARFLVILLGTTLLFSCRKETSVENPKGLQGDFTAVINGQQWIASDTARGATILAGLINISGVSADNKQLSITLSATA